MRFPLQPRCEPQIANFKALKFKFLWTKWKKKSISERAIIGFDHGLPCRMKNMAWETMIKSYDRHSFYFTISVLVLCTITDTTTVLGSKKITLFATAFPGKWLVWLVSRNDVSGMIMYGLLNQVQLNRLVLASCQSLNWRLSWWFIYWLIDICPLFYLYPWSPCPDGHRRVLSCQRARSFVTEWSI